MKKYFCATLFTFLIGAFSLQAQVSIDNPMGDDYYSQYSFATPMEEHKALLVELDSIRKNVDEKVAVSLSEAAVLRRMKASVKTIPLDYNSQVKYYIDRYTSSNYRPYMNRMHGLSKHYFKTYEQIFNEMGLPEEIKYLSLVESSLNPHLVSSAGAVGPWQFIYTTARIYDLDMNTKIDERKDIYSSTYAVSKYLAESYDQFNDWLLALASYNCGRGCVKRAIQRSGMQSPTFWELAPFLPKETQNYIPKYVAMTYVLSNVDFYNIEAATNELNYESKVVMVDKAVDLRHVAKAVNLEIEQLKHFNPAIKNLVVPGTVEKPKRLFLPITPKTNDTLLYLALNAPSSFSSPLFNEVETILASNSSQHRVQKGETLSSISKKFGVTVQDLKAWNALKNNNLVVGKSLIVSNSVNGTLAKNVAKTRTFKSTSATRTAYYTVKRGDSLDRIARREGSTVDKIKKDNGLKNTMIKPGMKLKITKG